MKKDKVVLAAVETGFPVFNNKYYYEVIYGWRKAKWAYEG
jgi:hypothetical protein